jgi:hypothetical protein
VLTLLKYEEAQLLQNGAPAALGRVQWRMAQEYQTLAQPAAALKAYADAVPHLYTSGAPQAAQAAAEWVRYAVVSGRYNAELAARIRALAPPLDGAALWAQLRDELQRGTTPDTVDQTATMLQTLRDHPPTTWPPAAAKGLDEALTAATALRADMDAERIGQALKALSANPQDAAAEAQVVGLGARAVPALRDALRVVLTAETADPVAERRLYDLLHRVAPAWSGYTADAKPEDKLKALDQLRS